jgi:peroxiredoxin
MWRALLIVASIVGCDAAATTSAPAKSPRVAIGPDSESIDATTIVGKSPPPWRVDWMGATPIDVADLRGSVVLVRWFTEGCPYCASTAPSLVAFDHDFRSRGLQVIGMYHHKSDEPLEVANVKALAAKFGFTFPVAIDHDWSVLKQWWLDAHPGWTSVSFLIDRHGTVRFVHTGGEYGPGSDDAAHMRRWIEQLLAQP